MANQSDKKQWINLNSQDPLLASLDAFRQDRKAQNMAPGTLYFYHAKLSMFTRFCDEQGVDSVSQIDADLLRCFMIWLEETGHNPGGQHTFYRAVKTFLKWYERENEPQGWNNPIDRVKAPRLPVQPLEPVSLDTVRILLGQCPADLTGTRDRAMILFLLDTGCRANEALSVTLQDVNIVSGEVIITSGKGGKPRFVYLGRTARKALRDYLHKRKDRARELWITRDGTGLTYAGLRSMITRRARQANIGPPQLHAFRRAFALNMLRNGTDIFTLQRLMGHADIQMLRRYLAQTSEDLQAAHHRASPGDSL